MGSARSETILDNHHRSSANSIRTHILSGEVHFHCGRERDLVPQRQIRNWKRKPKRKTRWQNRRETFSASAWENSKSFGPNPWASSAVLSPFPRTNPSTLSIPPLSSPLTNRNYLSLSFLLAVEIVFLV